MLCRPPRSKLFPYTTLFRSQRRLPAGLVVGDRHARRQPLVQTRHVGPAVGVGEGDRDGHHEGLPPDRKSTRLNSSHTVSSYAVFCLKKKTESSPRHAYVP